MSISLSEIKKLIAETPREYIIESYREKWEGICAIASHHLQLTPAQKSLVVSVHAHAVHRRAAAHAKQEH